MRQGARLPDDGRPLPLHCRKRCSPGAPETLPLDDVRTNVVNVAAAAGAADVALEPARLCQLVQLFCRHEKGIHGHFGGRVWICRLWGGVQRATSAARRHSMHQSEA